MLKNITLSADVNLIREALKKALRENTTLNAQFHQHLKYYLSIDSDYEKLMDSLSYAHPSKKFTRDEMNERR